MSFNSTTPALKTEWQDVDWDLTRERGIKKLSGDQLRSSRLGYFLESNVRTERSTKKFAAIRVSSAMLCGLASIYVTVSPLFLTETS
jgi:hypothetical protein